MKTQEQLFEEWYSVCNKLKMLKGFIQNDFDKMLSYNHITKEQIRCSIREFNDLYDITTKHMGELKTEIENLMLNYSK